MSNLLQELGAASATFPELTCFVPEWGRSVTLRGFSVLEARELRRKEPKNKEGEIADADRFTMKCIAHSIVDGNERPLANDQGLALVEALSEGSAMKLWTKVNDLRLGVLEKNSATTGNGAVSSALPVEEEGPLPN